MNILVIHGSMRRGNTYRLAQEVISLLKSQVDVTVEEIEVSDLNLPLCISCHQCFKKGEQFCPHFKIIHDIAERVEHSDGIILTGVVYSMSLNAAMKNLIDHLSYYCHRPRLFDKKGMVITTTANISSKKVAKYLKSIMSLWGVNNIRMLYENHLTDPLSLTPKQKDNLEKQTEGFLASIRNNTYKSPDFNTIAGYNSFRGMSAAKSISECDSNYWHETGLEKKVYPIKHSMLKKIFGTIVYKTSQ